MVATLQIQPIPVPLAADSNGVVRVGGTRVTLDTVVTAFLRGATAEEIAQQYPSLLLPDICATISYYLQNRGEVDTNLEKRRKHAEADVSCLLESARAELNPMETMCCPLGPVIRIHAGPGTIALNYIAGVE